MGQTAFMLIVVTILSKVFGFVREAVMANYYGTGDIAAVYAVANTFPVVIANFVANGIIFGFIPMYNRVKNEKGEKEAEGFTSNIFNILLVIAVVAVVIGLIFARPFSKLFSPDLNGPLLDMATTFTRIIMFAIFAFFYSAVYRGYLNLKGNFIIPATTGIIMNVIIIAFIVISGISRNPYYLAMGCLLGNVLQYVLFPRATKKVGYKHKFKLDFHNKYVRQLVLISIPVIISAAAGEIALIVDNSMASYYFGNNTISVLKYAKQLLALITGVITVSVTTSMFPTISFLGQSGKIEDMKKHISSAVVLSLLLLVPATIGMMVLAEPIVRVIFARNQFNNNSVMATSSILVVYAPYVIFQSFSDVIDKGFYSVGDSKTPVMVVVVQQIINIILNFVFLKFFGLNGIALATAVSCLFGAMMMLYMFRKNFGRMQLKTTAISIIKIAIISLIMGILCIVLYKLFSQALPAILSLLLVIIIAVIFYVLAILLARIPEVIDLINKLYHKFIKKRKRR